MTHIMFHGVGSNADCNLDRRSGITAVFNDDSRVTILHLGTDAERRQRYIYVVWQFREPKVVTSGCDLRSGVGEPVNFRKALAAWTSFATADADTYRAAMTGDRFQEWAYQHDTELSELAIDLEDQGDPVDADNGGPVGGVS